MGTHDHSGTSGILGTGETHTHTFGQSPGMAVYAWDNQLFNPKKDDPQDGRLMGHCTSTDLVMPEPEELPRFGGGPSIKVPSSEPSSLVLSGWAEKIALPMAMNQPSNPSDGVMGDRLRIIHCLLQLLGGAVHIDSHHWAQAAPSEVEIKVLRDPWMMQVKLP